MRRGFGRRQIFRAAALAALAAGGPGSAAAADWAGGGPSTGWVRDLLRDGDGTLWAGTYGGGIFRSFDDGRSWESATDNTPDAVVIDLHEGLGNFRFLYAATLDQSLLRKEPGSDFWSPLSGFPAGYRVPGNAVENFPGNPDRIAYGSVEGVFISNDNGGVWPDTTAFAIGEQVQDLLVLADLPNTIHAVTPFEIWTTANSGQSVQVYADGLAPITYLLHMEPWSTGTDSILVADLRGPLWQFVGRSHFEEIGPFAPSDDSRKYFSQIDPSDSDRVLVGSSAGLWLSGDRLASWELVDHGLPVDEIELWAIDDSALGVGDSLGLGTFTLGYVRTGEGGQGPWTVSNDGLNAAWVRSLSVGADRALCGTAHGRLFLSTDQGASWEDVTGSLRTLQIAACHDDGETWVVSGSNGVFWSADGGVAWALSSLPAGVNRLNHIISGGGVLHAISDRGLVRSDDGGKTFTLVAGLPADRPGFGLAMDGDGTLAIGLEPESGSFGPSIWIGTAASGFDTFLPPAGFRGGIHALAFLQGQLFVGADSFGGVPLYRLSGWQGGGAGTWDSFADYLPLEAFETTGLAARGNVLVVGTAEWGVFLSPDEGLTWQEWNEGLASRRIEALRFGPSSGRDLWVGTLARGAWRRELPAGVPVLVSGLAASPGRGGEVRVSVRVASPVELRVERRSQQLGHRLLFAAVADADLTVVDRLSPSADPAARLEYVVQVRLAGQWREVARIERAVRELVAPRRSRLLAAEPNPFNPRTTLRFEIAEAGPVRLELFDARGRRVAVLVDAELGAGPHSRSFEGTDLSGATLASGVYYARLVAPDGVTRSRITLIR